MVELHACRYTRIRMRVYKHAYTYIHTHNKDILAGYQAVCMHVYMYENA